MRMRIVGCGNMHRGDDAAGLLVVHRLRDAGVDAHEAPGDLLSLIDQWTRDEHLVLIDAVMAEMPAGTVLQLGPGDLPREAKRFRYSTHGIGVQELIGLASALGRLPARVTVIGIVGDRFEPGVALSAAVRRAVVRVAGELAAHARDLEASEESRAMSAPGADLRRQ